MHIFLLVVDLLDMHGTHEMDLFFCIGGNTKNCHNLGNNRGNSNNRSMKSQWLSAVPHQDFLETIFIKSQQCAVSMTSCYQAPTSPVWPPAACRPRRSLKGSSESLSGMGDCCNPTIAGWLGGSDLELRVSRSGPLNHKYESSCDENKPHLFLGPNYIKDPHLPAFARTIRANFLCCKEGPPRYWGHWDTGDHGI